MIDWSELKTYENNKYRSFEELCYQIAKGLHGGEGKFTSVDDSGGGDGVEFYLTLPNGEQWGWQAKFYHHPKGRLDSSRKQSITKSLKKACEVHPNLKKWFLCTTSNFTPKEQEWFDNTLPQSIPENMHVELEHWGDSDFNTWLSEPRFRGKLLYFFRKLELDLEWFKTQFDKQMAGVGDKFDPSLHTETRVDAEIHALLGDKAFVQQIAEWIAKFEKELSDLKEAINKLNSPIPYIEWNGEEKSKIIAVSESLQDVLINIIDKFEENRKLLDKQELTAAQAIDWAAVFGELCEVFDDYGIVTKESGISQIKYIGEEENREQTLRKVSSFIHGPRSIVARLCDKFFPSVIWKLGLINKSDLNVLGDAGIGKTHIACNICDDRLKNGLPALFVRGSQFRTDQAAEVQLRELLDIPPSYSWHDFLQALSATAEAYRTRIPLIIDGLNESLHNGTFSKIWELGLTGLVQEIKQTKNLVLITTCRSSYKETIWKDATSKEYNPKKLIWQDKDSLNLVYAYGFYTDEVKQEAIDKYFNTYKIKADLTFAPLAQFEHPIYLKIFCETKNRERENEVQVYVGEQTLFEVFDEYLSQCNQAVCECLERHPRTIIVQSALNKMAAYLWQHRSREIPCEELVHIVDGQSREDLVWPSSKTRAIESEGLLVYREWTGVGEVMHFTYDLLGGYLIAKYLVEQAADDVHGFLNSEEIVAALFSEDHQTLHPMHEDIVRCLAALLPSATGHFLHEFSDHNKAISLSIRALFEISPDDINEKCINLVTHLFDQYPENRNSFFKLAESTVGHPDHPFNASFWSERLSALSMAERDLSWTEYVRYNRYDFENILERLEETCQNDQDISDYSKKRLLLLAEYILWILTSTVRPLRDKTTRALYWYGRRFPQEFFDLALKSFTINDPYVSERMLAATYGIAMARQNDFDDTSFVDEMLPKYAKQLYESMFKPNAPHATTHILARDYAKRTIDIALIHQPNLLTDEEKLRIKPPYTDGGIRVWQESEEKNKNEYQDKHAPLHLDFRNYTLGQLVKDRGPYDFQHPEYKRVVANIFWRIYDLGFSLENFGKIDKWISEENWNRGRYNEDPRKIDRYGKKYSWIAFYELAGFRRDKDLFPDYYDDMRVLNADIDPSFPDEQREYKLVTEDFLGDREVSAEEWIAKTSPPDLTRYLKVDHLCGEQGPWVLLKGYMSQKDDQANRDMFAFWHGLIIKSEEVEEMVEILKKQEKIDRSTLPFCPEDHYTYAGEIPWCDTYQENSWTEVSLKKGTVLVPEEQRIILRDGDPVPDEELQSFLDSIVDMIETDDPFDELLDFYNRNSITNLIDTRIWETIKSQWHKRDFELKTKTVNVEHPEYQEFEMLVPVRENSWTDSQSAAVPGRNVTIPSKQIAETFSLCGQPQSFDLFEKDGRCASMTFRCGEEWGNTQDFAYLRQDLLESYLEKIGGELIWVIWGNRRLVSENPDDPYENFQDVKTYHEIQ